MKPLVGEVLNYKQKLNKFVVYFSDILSKQEYILFYS